MRGRFDLPMDDRDPAPSAKIDPRLLKRVLAVNPDLAANGLLRDSTPPASEQTPTPDGAAFDSTVTYFIGGKSRELETGLAELETQRRTLAAKEEQLKARVRTEVAQFLAVLDRDELERRGVAALTEHHSFLARVGLTAKQLVAATKK